MVRFVSCLTLVALLFIAVPRTTVAAPAIVYGTLDTRGSYSATALADGRVLLAGGAPNNGSTPLGSSQLYDPATGRWSETGRMPVPLAEHGAVRLNDGRVLVVGGYFPVYPGVRQMAATAELYDPATGRWSLTGSLANARYGHTTTLLADGSVLVVGGGESFRPLATAERYDPATGRWRAAGSLNVGRVGHTATLLNDGRVLVFGGTANPYPSAAELYDPATDSWQAVGNNHEVRSAHTATLLPDGAVLIVGGQGAQQSAALSSVERYEPTTQSVREVAALHTARLAHTATLLNDGSVLVTGGVAAYSPTATTERYNQGTDSWADAGSLGFPRSAHVATRLADGTVLVTQGPRDTNYDRPCVSTSTPDLYDPASGWQRSVGTATLTFEVNGTPANTFCAGTYPRGAVVFATPPSPVDNTGTYIATEIAVDGVPVGWPWSFTLTMDSDHLVSARYVPRPTFSDMPGGDDGTAVQELATRGIVRGYGDGRFGTGDRVLRAQMAGLLVRAMGWENEDWGTPFHDRGEVDADLWRAVGTLAHYDVARGYADGTYAPTEPLSHIQMISLITRAMVAKGYWTLQPDNLTLYPNIPTDSGHRQDVVTYAYYLYGLPETHFTSPTFPMPLWEQSAEREWFTLALWAALNQHFGTDLVP